MSTERARVQSYRNKLLRQAALIGRERANGARTNRGKTINSHRAERADLRALSWRVFFRWRVYC